MATYTAYVGSNTQSYLGWWGPGGTWRGHNIAMDFLKNAGYSDAIGLGIASDDAATGYLYRYDPTSSAGWASQLIIPSNEVPTSVNFDGNGYIWAVSDDPNSAIRYCGIYLGCGSDAGTYPYFSSRVKLGTRSMYGDGTAAIGYWTIPAWGRKRFSNTSMWLYLDLQSDGTPTTNRGIRFRGRATVYVSTTSRPSVTAGSVITKSQMDSLRNWKATIGITATAVTQGDTIKASIGNTYRSTWNPVSASWYNGD